MATLKERFQKWKETRTLLQKAGDIFFWVLLVLLILPGPRKVISTTCEQGDTPGEESRDNSEEKQISPARQVIINWIIE